VTGLPLPMIVHSGSRW